MLTGPGARPLGRRGPMLGAWRNHLLWGMQLTWLGSMVGSDGGSRPGETGRPGRGGPGPPGRHSSRCGAQAAGISPRRGEVLDRRRECLVASGAHLGSWGFGEGGWGAWG